MSPAQQEARETTGRRSARLSDGTVDVLAIASLGAVSLAVLATTFAGALWAVMGLTAMLLGITVAHLCVRAAGVYLAALPFLLLVAYAVLAVPITSRYDGLASVVPTGTSLADLLRGSVGAWGELIATLPRVDSEGIPLLVPVILGLFPPALATMLAAGTSRPVLPLVPLLGGLAVGFVVGRGDVAPWPVGVAFGMAALAWIRHRGARTDGARRVVTRPQLVGMTALLLLGALLASLLTGGAGAQSQQVLRETAAEGMDTAEVPSLLSGFRRYTKKGETRAVDNVHDRKLLTLDGAPRQLRMRFAVLDRYDGNEWRPDPDLSPEASTGRFLKLDSTLDNPATGARVGVRVRVHQAWIGNWVPTAGVLQELDFYLDPERPDLRDEVRYNVGTGTALLPGWLKGGDQYYFESVLPDDTLSADDTPADEVDPELFDRADFVDDIAQGFLAQHDTPMQALFAAAARLRTHGRYSDGAEGWQRRFRGGHGTERLGQLFLRAPQIVGNDEQYAAAMALIATRMRIPARVVVGALTPGSGVIRGRHVHAWVEAQLADGSWRTLPTRSFMGRRSPTLDAAARKARAKARARDSVPLVPSVRTGRGSGSGSPSDRRERSRRQQQERRQPDRPANEPPEQQTSPDQPSDPLGEPWWLLLGLLGVVPTAKAVRRTRRRRRSDVSARFAGAWDELADTGRDLGHRLSPRTTRPAQAASLGCGLALAERADDRVFGVADPTGEQAESYWTDLMSERDALLGSVPRWRRLLAALNPASLLWRRHG